MSKAACFSSDLIEVFSTTSGTVYQSDRENCLFIDFAGKFSRYTLNHLCSLKSVLCSFNVENLLLDPYSSLIEIVSVAGCEHCFVLTTVEIAAFQQLLQGTFVMFELNHIIHDRLHRIIA